MFGGRWMDTFMDKLAQKLNAQEMIKANSAADAEEMDQLKSQLREYDECLAQMQQVNKELKAINHEMEKLMSETITPEVTRLSEEGAAAFDKLQQESVAKLQELQQDNMKYNICHSRNQRCNRNAQYHVKFSRQALLDLCRNCICLLLIFLNHSSLYIAVYFYAFLMYAFVVACQLFIQMTLQLFQCLSALLNLLQLCRIFLAQLLYLCGVVLLQFLQFRK